jgi:hypothetical protein
VTTDDAHAVAGFLADHHDLADLLEEAALRAGADAVLHELTLLSAARAGQSLDTPRIEVRLQGHPVFAGRDHAYLMVIVDDHPAFEDDPRFANVLEDGRRYATLGAGPKNMNPFFSTLVSKVNRHWDTNPLLPDTFDIEIQHPDVIAGRRTERAVVEELFATDAGFNDGLDYDIVPFRWSGGYNSNSFLSGLLEVSGWDVEAPDGLPGWDKPVPDHAFGGITRAPAATPSAT